MALNTPRSTHLCDHADAAPHRRLWLLQKPLQLALEQARELWDRRAGRQPRTRHQPIDYSLAVNSLWPHGTLEPDGQDDDVGAGPAVAGRRAARHVRLAATPNTMLHWLRVSPPAAQQLPGVWVQVLNYPGAPHAADHERASGAWLAWLRQAGAHPAAAIQQV
jgi:hypothetical protein